MLNNIRNSKESLYLKRNSTLLQFKSQDYNKN